LTSLIQTTIGTVLGPLVASRQTIERQSDQLVRQAEQLGRQDAELERADSTIVTLNAALEARTAVESVPASSGTSMLGRFLGLWRWLVLVLVVAMTTMVTLLAWPR
jgi:hypothetical protein